MVAAEGDRTPDLNGMTATLLASWANTAINDINISGPSGIEPAEHSCVQGRRSPSWAGPNVFWNIGKTGFWTATPGPKQVLYQAEPLPLIKRAREEVRT